MNGVRLRTFLIQKIYLERRASRWKMQTNIQRKILLSSRIPMSESETTWRVICAYQNYFRDIWSLRVDTEIPVSRLVLEKRTVSQIITKLSGSVDIHKCLSLATLLRQISPVHFITYHFRKIHISVILFLLPSLSRAPHTSDYGTKIL
jgi:hypothetical protein